VLAKIRSFKLVFGWFTTVCAAPERSRFIARWTALWVVLSLSGGFQSSIQWIGKWLYRGDQSLNLKIFIVNLGVSPSASTSVERCPVAYLGYGRHGTCHGRHFGGGAKIVWQKWKFVTYSFLNLMSWAPCITIAPSCNAGRAASPPSISVSWRNGGVVTQYDSQTLW